MLLNVQSDNIKNTSNLGQRRTSSSIAVIIKYIARERNKSYELSMRVKIREINTLDHQLTVCGQTTVSI